jgi:hypothetical protein
VLWEYRVVEQRYDAVMEVRRDGRTVTEVAERWGVSRQSLYAWMDRYAVGGLEGWPIGRIVLAAVPIRSRSRWRCGSVSCADVIPTGGRGGCTTSSVGMVWHRCRRGRRSTGPWSATS